MTKKRNTRRGASVVLALVIFLMCALGGASVLVMASANAGRYSHTDEQDYYSVSSAALLVVDMLDGLTYTSATIQYDYMRTWESAGGTNRDYTDKYTLTLPETGSSVSGAPASALNGIKLLEKIKAQCDGLVPCLDVPEEWYATVAEVSRPALPARLSYTFSLNVTGDGRFGAVSCELVMNDNYDIILTFKGADGQYALTAYWPAERTAEKKSKDPQYGYLDPTDKSYQTGSHKIENTLNVTVQWNKAKVTISRGETQGGAA